MNELNYYSGCAPEDILRMQQETEMGVELEAKIRSEIPLIAGEPMVCEKHFWLLWPHDDCPGPGMPLSAAEGYNKQLCTARTALDALQAHQPICGSH